MRRLGWVGVGIVAGLLLVWTAEAMGEEPAIRVAILTEVDRARLTVLEPCRLVNIRDGTVLAQWPHLKWQEVSVDGSSTKIAGTPFFPQAIRLEPQGQRLFRVNARLYRGDLLLYRTDRGKLTLVNRLGLEEYLVGALASETSPQWPMEALKAHAVASRTMVAHRIWISKGKPFDVTADTSTHLYHGAALERWRTQRAVDETRGQVLTYAGELFSAVFHANCGGHTEDAAEIWQVKKEIPPLKGREDPYCQDLRHSRWHMELSLDECVRVLANAGEDLDLGEIRAVEILDRNRSGRVRRIRFLGSRRTVTLTGRKLREILGANRLRSLNFTAVVTDGKIVFHGKGWGHGVGLCQWGAYGMARRGKKAKEILNFYFPGSEIRDLRGLPGFDES